MKAQAQKGSSFENYQQHGYSDDESEEDAQESEDEVLSEAQLQ